MKADGSICNPYFCCMTSDYGNSPVVLSIQSSVTWGRAGNSAVVPVLCHLGVEPATINTVQLAAHGGYPEHPGASLPHETLVDICDALHRMNILPQLEGGAVLSGYAGAAETVNATVAVVQKAREVTKNQVIWVLDPVLGDEVPGMYVPHGVREAHLAAVPQADVVVPNQFEFDVLTTTRLSGTSSLVKHCRFLQETRGWPNIVVTSARVGQPGKICVIIVETNGSSWLWSCECVATHNRAGSGDAFAAAMTARLLQGDSLSAAAAAAAQIMHGLYAVTLDHRARELALAAAARQGVFASPPAVGKLSLLTE